METIGAWLNRLGLGMYETTFEANRIDLEVATQLSNADLKDLGVRALGDRKRLLQAIADLRSNRELLGPKQWERRQLTVMFCDLKGSTVLATQLDPEDLASVIGAYQRCCAAVIARYDGFIARYVGDGIIVYFGYPQAHEDDAERAIHAALAIVEDVSVAPDSYTITLAISLFLGMVVGGAGWLPGSIIGSAFIIFVPNIAEGISKGLSGAVFGVLLFLVIFLVPHGAHQIFAKSGRSTSRYAARGPKR